METQLPPQSEQEDWIYRIITDSVKSELNWRALGRLEEAMPERLRGRLHALCMNANPAFGDSVERVLHRDDPARFWRPILDGDPVTIRLVIHEVFERINELEAEEEVEGNDSTT